MYAQQIIVAALMAFGAVTEARVIESRQIGNLQCNLARLQIVGALSATQNNVNSIQDATVKAAAEAGVKQAQSGISTIAQSLFAGEKAPAAARDVVLAGLTATGTALKGGSQTDKAITDATANLARASSAGQQVLAQCK